MHFKKPLAVWLAVVNTLEMNGTYNYMHVRTAMMAQGKLDNLMLSTMQ